MKISKSFYKYMAATAVVAMYLTSCSSDNHGGEPDVPSEPEQPENPLNQPTMVVYEANPRFFGTQDCLNSLTTNLQRIYDMGCDVVWIMPVCEPSTGNQSVGSPYSIKNYEAINPRYGTIEDLVNLVKTAHGIGLKVILDWVPNHTGWDNPWIEEHPEWFMHNSKGEIISPPGQGWNDVAQLDYSNPGVAEGMTQAIKYWVNAAGVDGFRFDYADSPHIPASFWKELSSDLKAMNPNMILLAESSNYSFYDYGYDMIYDWNSAPTISGAFTGGKATSVVEEGQAALANVPEKKSILRYVFNHDTMSEKPIDTYYGSLDALPAAYVCASMLNGTPLIYSGMDAEGLKGQQSFFNYKTITFSEKLTPVYKTINDIFKATANLRSGELTNYSANNVVAFTRQNGSHYLLVIVNCSGSEVQYVTPMALRFTSMKNELTGVTDKLPVSLNLPAYGYAIYSN